MDTLPFVSRPANLTRSCRDHILTRWETRVRSEVKFAEGLSTPSLMDTLPLFLEQLAEALDENHERVSATDSSNVAEEHGGERARLSPFGPEQIIQEYAILRDVIAEFLESEQAYSTVVRKVVERSIDDATRQAMTAFFLVHNRLRTRFVATLSHDLRSPLSIIKLAADLLMLNHDRAASTEAFPRNRELIEKILKNSERIDEMTAQLLDDGALQFGERLSIDPRPCEAHAIVESVAREKRVEDQKQIIVSGANVTGYWDLNLLTRAVENLISNAIKYGDGSRPVTAAVSTVGGRMMISIHNQGNAIPVDERGLLFQSFRRTASAKASGKTGWGIGLSFVRTVAESHGGSVGVDSSPEGGTTFTIDIPRDSRPFLNAPITH